MEYYCLMVRTGSEAEYKKQAQKVLADHGIEASLYYFQRRLKKGKGDFFDAPLFPGYLFLQVEGLRAEVFELLRQVKHFCRLLPSNTAPQMIRGGAKAFYGARRILGDFQGGVSAGKKNTRHFRPLGGLGRQRLQGKQEEKTDYGDFQPESRR